jgi:dipicolinate synthase subunit A
MGIFSGWRAVVIGGDAREQVLCDLLEERGATVRLYGHDPAEDGRHLAALVTGRWVVAPVSGIDGDGRVKAPHGTVELRPAAVSRARGVIAGAIAPAWAARVSVPTVAYREADVFAWKNAVPTAEGALAWALHATPRVLSRAVAVLVGFGRVAQILAPRLGGVGAVVRVLARDPAERAHAAALGWQTGEIGVAGWVDADLVFNTVPVPLFDVEHVAALPATARVLDMASPPGGFRPAARERLGPRLDWHPSLPGEIAPASAAAIICETLEWLVPTLPLSFSADCPESGST